MSILRSLVNSLKAAVSNKAFEMIQLQALENQIKEALEQVTADGTITADEIADVKELTDKLNLSSEQFDHIRLRVLKNLVTHILADGKVSEEEMKLYQEVESSIALAEQDDELKANVAKIKELFGNV